MVLHPCDLNQPVRSANSCFDSCDYLRVLIKVVRVSGYGTTYGFDRFTRTRSGSWKVVFDALRAGYEGSH
jgi:hypothetical protein